MCNVAPAVMSQLEQTVKQFLDEGRMFTAYDVTIETRTREKCKLRHSDLRGAVHEIQVLSDAVEFGYDGPTGTVKWSKTQIPVPNSQWAFVYHPSSLDPTSYASAVAPAPSVSGIPVPTPATAAANGNGSVSDSGGQNADGTFGADYRNRLLVPTRFMREVGFKPGDSVSIISVTGEKKVLLVADPSLVQVDGTSNSKVVERNGDIRLYSSILRDAGLDSQKFKIEVEEMDDINQGKTKVVSITEG